MRSSIILHFSFTIGDSLGIPWGFPVIINRISRDIPVWAGSRPVAVKGRETYSSCMLGLATVNSMHLYSRINYDKAYNRYSVSCLIVLLLTMSNGYISTQVFISFLSLMGM